MKQYAQLPNGRNKKMLSLVAIGDDKSKFNDPLFTTFTLSKLYSQGHFAELAQELFEEKWNNIINGNYESFEVEWKKLCEAVLDPHAVDNYAARYEERNEEPPIDPKVLHSLKRQLNDWLNTVTSSGKQKKGQVQLELPLLFGFIIPFWSLNHRPLTDKQDPNYVHPCVVSGKADGYSKYLFHLKQLTAIFLKFIRYTDGGDHVERQISDKKCTFIYPGRIKQLLEEMQHNASYLHLFKLPMSIPNITFLAYIEHRMNFATNALGGTMYTMVEKGFNWAIDKFWVNQTFKYVYQSPPKVQIIRAPTSMGIAIHGTHLPFLPLHSKLAAVGPQNMVGVLGDSYEYGEDLLTSGLDGIHLNEQETKHMNEFYSSHGLRLIDTSNSDTMWSGVIGNKKYLQYRLFCLVVVGPPIAPDSPAMEWAHKHLSKFSSSMF